MTSPDSFITLHVAYTYMYNCIWSVQKKCPERNWGYGRTNIL